MEINNTTPNLTNKIQWAYLGIQKRIKIALINAIDAFRKPELIPVPSREYVPSRDVVESFCAKRGIRGGIITKGDHDALIASLRGYNFSDTVINETRIKLNAHDFWDTDLPTPRGMDPNYYHEWRRTKDIFIP